MPSTAQRLDSLTQTIAAAAAATRARPGGRGLAVGFAEALRHAWPDASLSTCRLPHDVAVLDAQGQDQPERHEALRGGVLEAPGQSVLVQLLTWEERELGLLALALPAASAPAAAAELALVAQALAPLLAAAELQADLAGESPKADVGELAGSLIHDFSNLLNNLLLNFMVLEQSGVDLSAVNLPKLRSRAEQVAALIKEVQDYRRQKPPPGAPTDLNAAARDAIALLNRDQGESLVGEFCCDLDLAPGLPPARGARTDYVRCLLFLLKSAARAGRAARRRVSLQTGVGPEGLFVRVEIRDLLVPVESPPRLYDTLATVCPTLSGLELATSKSVARRFGGKLSAACPPDTGLTLLLEVPAAGNG